MGPRDDEAKATPEGAAFDGEATGDGAERAESVEQYVRLHEHVERLRADARPEAPGALTREEADAYRMAALFRAAAPGADEPDPRFVSALLDRLEREASRPGEAEAPATAAVVAREFSAPKSITAPRAPRRGVSRRSLLGVGIGAAAAAAGLAVGVGIEKSQQPAAVSTQPTDVPLVSDSKGSWVAVAPLADIPVGAVKRFTTETIVGYVRHTSAGFSALSGVCTHMGCLLLWNGAARTFDCPCHGGQFTEDGASAPGSPVAYKPLPSLKTKIEADQVWVLVARDSSAATPTVGSEPYGVAG